MNLADYYHKKICCFRANCVDAKGKNQEKSKYLPVSAYCGCYGWDYLDDSMGISWGQMEQFNFNFSSTQFGNFFSYPDFFRYWFFSIEKQKIIFFTERFK